MGVELGVLEPVRLAAQREAARMVEDPVKCQVLHYAKLGGRHCPLAGVSLLATSHNLLSTYARGRLCSRSIGETYRVRLRRTCRRCPRVPVSQRLLRVDRRTPRGNLEEALVLMRRTRARRLRHERPAAIP